MGKTPKKKKASKRTPPKAVESSSAGQAQAGASPPPEQKPRVSLREYKESVKEVVRSSVNEFKKDIDPDKYAALKSETKKILTGGTVFLAVSLALASMLLLPELYFSGKVMPHTRLAGMDLGRLTPAEAKSRLMVETERYAKTPLTFLLDGKKVTLSPFELGAQISVDKSLETAPVVDFRDTGPLALAAGLLTERNLPLQFTLDREGAISKIEDQLDLKAKRAVNARLAYKDGEFTVQPEKQGVSLDRDRLSKALDANISRMMADPITLTLVTEQPRITAVELSAQKDRLVGLVGGGLELESGGKSLKINTAEHLEAIEFKERTFLAFKDLGVELPVSLAEQKMEIPADGPVKLLSRLEVAFNQEKIEPFLQENLFKDIEIPTSGVTITRNQDGKINIEGKGEDGKSVPKKRLIAGMNLAVNRRIGSVPVPVITDHAPVNISADLQELGIKELLATGHTSYYGSPPNRMHNIRVGIAKYNGVLVKPGEEFSFNTILGEVDARNGYLPEKVIKKNKAELEYGGGICQVSTTLYRAVLLAGLPVTERNPHSWKVSYYGQVLGHGLDATIYIGVSDVKFINDTPAYLLVQAYAEGANAYFKFYGTGDGRTAELDGPYGGGLNYKWYRIVKKGGEEIKETIVSNYKPIPPPDPPPEKPKEVAQKPADGPTL